MKKLFTLLTLLVAIVTGAQAQNPTYKSDFTDGQIIWTTSSNVDAAITAGWMKMNSTLSKKDLKGKKLIDPTTNEEASSAQYSSSEYFYVQKTFNSKASSDKSLYLYVSGLTKMTIYFYQNSDGGGRTMEAYNGEGSDATKLAGAEVISGGRCGYFDVTLDGEDNIIRLNATNELLLYAIKVEKAPAGPSITTHPVSATYADGDPISALTVTATASAGTLTYQWYSCDDADKTNATAIENATSASYTPTEEGFYYVNVKDDNGNVDSNVAHIEIEAASAPTISISAGGSTEVTAGASITLTAMAAGVPGPDIQWYVSDTNDTSAGTAISGATNATYTFDAVAGTKYYYATASNKVQSNVASNVVTVTAAARTGYTLNQVVFSNSFDAFITAPAAAVYFTQEEIDAAQEGDAAYGKTTEDIKTPAVAASIKAYYMQGETAPTVSSVNMSPGATYVVEGNTLTVTSEDGQTSVAYPITLSAVTPYDGTGTLTFDGTETWVKTGYNFSSDKGWKFAKNADDGRISEGRTRIYFFVGANETVTLTNGLINSERNVKVYVNGTQVTSITKVPKSSASPNSITVPCNTDAANMIAIISNQTGGDGGFSVISTPMPEITLDETGGNTAKISALAGKTANVTVSRTLSPNYYNSLFLPFAMTAEQITAAFGEGAQVATFTGMNSTTQFGFGNVDVMEANVPYLVKPTQEVNGFTVEGVTISNTAAAGVVDGGYSMVGTYDTFTNGGSTGGGSIGISIGGSSSSSANEIYYFTTSNTIKKLKTDGTGKIKGLRSFMVKLPSGKTSVETIVSNAGITFGGGGSGDARARQSFVLNLDDDNTTTGIEAIENGQLTIDNDAPAYNLAGQKVGKGYKGIVIINGKKVVK